MLVFLFDLIQNIFVSICIFVVYFYFSFPVLFILIFRYNIFPLNLGTLFICTGSSNAVFSITFLLIARTIRSQMKSPGTYHTLVFQINVLPMLFSSSLRHVCTAYQGFFDEALRTYLPRFHITTYHILHYLLRKYFRCRLKDHISRSCRMIFCLSPTVNENALHRFPNIFILSPATIFSYITAFCCFITVAAVP